MAGDVNRTDNAERQKLAEAVADGVTLDGDLLVWSSGDDDTSAEHLREIAAMSKLFARVGWATSRPSDEWRLAPGTAWGNLKVLEHIGAGRFGDVYRAWDPALDREVALKILREPSADDTNQTQVVEEGRLMARVRHPNVVTIFGAQRIGGVTGLWMELVDGRTLATELADRGPLSADELVRIGRDLCSALAAVHDAGLVHRDVKAQNVLREARGRIVLGDFGVGRELIQPEPRLAGTPVYIAPELFDGAAATPRSDIYSLGALLFYVATGTYPVVGRSLDEVRKAHGREQQRTHVRMLRPDLPAALAQTIDRALDPDPSRRFQDADAFRSALDSTRKRHGRGRVLRAGTTAAAALLGATMLLAFNTRTPDAPQTARVNEDALASIERTSVFPPPGGKFFFQAYSSLALSPDGQWLAFTALDATDTSAIWVQHVDSSAPRRFADTLGAVGLFWSPDSRWIGYSNQHGILKVSVDGGDPQIVCGPEHRFTQFGTWSADGIILFHTVNGGVHRAWDDGRGCAPLSPDAQPGHRWLSFLPDGRRFLYYDGTPPSGVRGIYVAAVNAPGSKLVIEAQEGVAQVASGNLLFMRDNKLLAAAFDSVEAAVTRPPRVIADGVLSDNAYVAIQPRAGRAYFSASQTGRLAYVKGEPTVVQLRWMNRGGDDLGAIPVNDTRGYPAISHDGGSVATEVRDPETGNSDIWVFDLKRRVSRRLTSHPARDYLPAWSPDDTQIGFVSDRLGRHGDIYRVNAEGSGEELLHSSEVRDDLTSWEGSGEHLVFNRPARPGGPSHSEIWWYSLRARAARPLVRDRGHAYSARMSPDGKWIAFGTLHGDTNQVWIRGVPPNYGEHMVGPGRFPKWRGDSREVFYLAPVPGPDEIKSVTVGEGPLLQVGPARRAFTLPDLAGHTFDISPDGERLLIRSAKSLETLERSSITLVKDWTKLLK